MADETPLRAAAPPSGRFGLRLAFWYAAVFVASSLAIVLLTYTLLASSLAERDRQIVTSTLREYSARYADGGLPALARAVDLEQRSGRHERMFVRVVRGGSETLFVSMPPELSDFDVSGLGGRSGLWEQAQSGSRAARLEVASARLPGGTLLQVGKSTENREELLARFRTIVTLVSVAIVLIGLAGGILVTRRTLEPIHRLIAAVSAITRTGSTDTRVPVGTDRDAINELSGLFNQMLDRISTLIEGMGSALDNVAHDLRTPMTRLRGVAERALASDPAWRQPPGTARGALDVPGGIRADPGDARYVDGHLGSGDRHDAARARTGRSRRAGPRSGQRLRGRRRRQADRSSHRASWLDAGLSVTGDRDRLRQVLANLVDNAIKYTPSGGRVTVSAAADGDSIRIEVADTGIGIAAHDLPRIWERLYRGDHSRAERGLGLGLSLVRAIVRAHGGTVDVSTELGRGSTFTIRLPRSFAAGS